MNNTSTTQGWAICQLDTDSNCNGFFQLFTGSDIANLDNITVVEFRNGGMSGKGTYFEKSGTATSINKIYNFDAANNNATSYTDVSSNPSAAWFSRPTTPDPTKYPHVCEVIQC